MHNRTAYLNTPWTIPDDAQMNMKIIADLGRTKCSEKISYSATFSTTDPIMNGHGTEPGTLQWAAGECMNYSTALHEYKWWQLWALPEKREE